MISVRDSRIYLLIAVAIGTFLRFYGLDIQSLWLDELYTVTNASLPLGELLVTLANNVHPPLHDLFMWLWVGAFGDSEVAVRLPSAIAGTLALFAQYFGAKRVFGRSVATTSTILFSLTFAGIFYAQEARSYSFLMLFAILSFYSYLSVLRAPSVARIVRFTILSSILMYTHYFGVLFVALQLVHWFVLKAARREWPFAPIATGFALLLLYAPWIGVVISTLADKGGGAFWIDPPSVLTFAHFLATVTYLVYSNMILTGVLVALFGFALAVLLVDPRFRENLLEQARSLRWSSPISIALILSAATVLIAVLVSLHTPVLTARNLLVIAPLLYVLAGYWISLSRWSAWKQSAYVFVVAILLLSIMLPSYYEPHKHQFRESLDYALSVADEESVLVVLGGDELMKRYEYYLERADARNVTVLSKDADEPITDVFVSDRLVIIGAHKSLLNEEDRELLLQQYRESDTRRFVRAEVSVYTR